MPACFMRSNAMACSQARRRRLGDWRWRGLPPAQRAQRCSRRSFLEDRGGRPELSRSRGSRASRSRRSRPFLKPPRRDLAGDAIEIPAGVAGSIPRPKRASSSDAAPAASRRPTRWITYRVMCQRRDRPGHQRRENRYTAKGFDTFARSDQRSPGLTWATFVEGLVNGVRRQASTARRLISRWPSSWPYLMSRRPARGYHFDRHTSVSGRCSRAMLSRCGSGRAS